MPPPKEKLQKRKVGAGSCVACAAKGMAPGDAVLLGLLVSQGRTIFKAREFLCEKHRATYQEGYVRFFEEVRSEVADKARRALG